MALGAVFRAAWPAQAEVPPDLDERLADLVSTAQAAWRELTISDEEYVRYLAERSPSVDVAKALENLCAADLLLACACARGSRKAVEAFEARFLSRIPQYVRRIDASPEFANELTQQLRAKLLVAAAGELPRIAQYAGACPLGAWLRVVAVREALMVGRRVVEAPSDPADLAALALAAGSDADRELVRLRYQPEFQVALETALAGLDAKERNLLRLHYVEGLSIDRLSPMFGVHRATCARWIAAAQGKLLDAIRERLQAQLGLSTVEFHSLAGLMVSGLHISITRMLADSSSNDG
jgi:RNA polymerase sigma-70 factor (ECF subfamily)